MWWNNIIYSHSLMFYIINKCILCFYNGTSFVFIHTVVIEKNYLRKTHKSLVMVVPTLVYRLVRDEEHWCPVEEIFVFSFFQFTKTQFRTTLENTLISYGGHISTLQWQRRDESQHIAQLLQAGELPVGAVVTAAHGPCYHGSRNMRSKDGGGESLAVQKGKLANLE